MPTLRHPKTKGRYEALTDEQAAVLAESGWVEDKRPTPVETPDDLAGPVAPADTTADDPAGRTSKKGK